MRSIFVGVAAASLILAAACTQQAPSDEMGPMPVVAALYDFGGLPATQDERETYFTRELATALTANAETGGPGVLDFDYRSWANDPEVENIRYRVGVHSGDGHAEISTNFSHSVGGAMDLRWDMCRRADGQWRIENITAQPLPTEEGAPLEEAVSIRTLLGISEMPPAECV